MKKVQNLLTRPEQLRKKLECPSFRHDFVQWSKSQLFSLQNRHTRSKSPNQLSKKKLNSSLLKNNHHRSKQNITPNSLSKNNSISKKIINPNKTFLQPRLKYDKINNFNNNSIHTQSNHYNNNNIANNNNYNNNNNNNNNSNNNNSNNNNNYNNNNNNNNNNRKKGQSHSLTHFHSLNNINHSISLDESGGQRYRTNYSSVHKNREDTRQKMREKKKRLQQISQQKKQVLTQKKIQFKYSCRTRQGVQISNPNKINQDRILIKTKICGMEKNLFAVADGHGIYGHLVAQHIVQNYITIAEKQFISKNVQESLPVIYDQLQKMLNNSEINSSCSGSTLVSVVIEDNNIVCANVGDSRAILARQVDRKSWEMIYLSQDQKPSVQAERRRIIKHGGKIQALRDQNGQPIGPLRVWLPNQSYHDNYVGIQGLAMSRSIGDNVSKPYGVTHKPEIIKIAADKRDKFILIASDGVWEFITNQEVLQLIVPFYRQGKLQQACDALLKLSYQRWTVEDNSVIDDITFVLIFLE